MDQKDLFLRAIFRHYWDSSLLVFHGPWIFYNLMREGAALGDLWSATAAVAMKLIDPHRMFVYGSVKCFPFFFFNTTGLQIQIHCQKSSYNLIQLFSDFSPTPHPLKGWYSRLSEIFISIYTGIFCDHVKCNRNI